MAITILRTVRELRQLRASLHQKKRILAVVPTMGALHDGHLSLIHKAKEYTDMVMATIFVNPRQFSEGEDFDRYPRPLSADIEKLETYDIPYVYVPNADEIYPKNFQTSVQVDTLSSILCGAIRPNFFSGVALIICKLFNQCQPDIAIFGEKDYQQLCIIKKLTRDLDFDVNIIGASTVRNSQGLALSSRNNYLTDAEHHIAHKLYNTLQDASKKLTKNAPFNDVMPAAYHQIMQAGFNHIDYIEWRDAEHLETMTIPNKPSRLLVAAHLGKARLIDNIEVGYHDHF